MVIQDVVDLAKYSELSSTAIKDNTRAIILFMNAGMLELYKRFPIKIAEHVVTLITGTVVYSLPADFLYALNAYGAVEEGEIVPPQIAINEKDNVYSVHILNHTEIRIPTTITSPTVSLVYGVKPTYYDEDDLAEELYLPETLIEPLLHYIGYKAHLGIRGTEDSETNSHYLRFDRSCKKARELGVAYPMESWEMPNRVYDKGFV